MAKKKTIDQIDIFSGTSVAGYRSIVLTTNSIPIFSDELRKGCEVCNNLKEKQTLPVTVRGNPNSDILIVGQGPGQSEDEKGIPFCGSSGRYIDTLLKQSNIDPDADCLLTNTVLCHFGKREPPADAFHNCREYFVHLLHIFKPKAILSLGLLATKELVVMPDGIAAHQIVGSWMQSRYNIPVFAIYHPAFVLRPEGRRYEQQTKKHLSQFRDQAVAIGCIINGYKWKKRGQRPEAEYSHPEGEVPLDEYIDLYAEVEDENNRS